MLSVSLALRPVLYFVYMQKTSEHFFQKANHKTILQGNIGIRNTENMLKQLILLIKIESSIIKKLPLFRRLN